VPHYEKVRYEEVYPGIDLIYYGTGRQLEYDFELRPFMDPSSIQIEFDGVRGISLGPEGDLILDTPAGEIRHQRPIAFQRRGAHNVAVDAWFVIRENRVGFEIGRYDRSIPLTIDPKLEWSSFLGGTGNDQGNDLIVDAAGNVYTSGFTQTVATDTDPPVPPTLQTPISSGFEAFITKLDSSGAVVYSTYFGGSPLVGANPLTVDDEAHSLAFDGFGSIYVTGYTFNRDFPIVNGFQTNLRGVQDAYLVKVDAATGTLQYSTYLGGDQSDRAYGVAVDSAGNAYLAGSTLSVNFPVVSAFQPTYGSGLRDGFLTKVTVAGTIGFSTYFGGRGDEQVYDVAVDSAGEIILTGYTTSINFPISRAVFPTYRGGIDDAFIAKFNDSGSSLVFSTYWGGNDSENGVRLATDSNNAIYIAGLTSSGLDFPLKSPAQLFNAGRHDAFLIKLHPDGQDADFATFLGGEDIDGATSVAVDGDGIIYVGGFTSSASFYAINAVRAFVLGDRDGFLTKIAPDASAIIYSTYMGGFGVDGITAVALDASKNAYATGFASSGLLFPIASNAFQSDIAGQQDAFIIRIGADDIKTGVSYTFPANGGMQTSTAGLTAQPIFGYGAVDILSGTAPAGLAILDLRSGGALLNEVSLPIARVSLVGRVFTSTITSSATALTIVNPHDEEVRVDIYFTANGQGTNVFRNFTLPPRSQVSGFTYAAPYSFPVDQIGTLTYTAALPVAAVALRSSASGGASNVYLPIVDPYSANPDPVTIPQYADGGGWTGQIFLVNPTEDVITGELRFFRGGLTAGEPGQPLEIATSIGTASVFTYSIEPRQSFAVSTFGSPTEIIPGYVDIVPAVGTNTPQAFAVLNFSGSPFLTTTVEAVKAANEFRMYAERTGTFFEPLGTMPAISLANSLDTPATVTVRLFGLDGADTGLSSVITLPPRGHLARFLHELPGFENPPASFRGVLRATTSQPGVTFAGFRARYNELFQFFITATGPLKDPGANLPVIFPHLVDGGGYASQLILIHNGGTGAGTGNIRYLNPLGDPLNVAILPD
ncbi:MAG TPA: SBBP repeat-containing protein, partial [Terriglobia bacterium]|nr:SBBP repeat-containing protein [Terriglobia bacterium]